MMFSRIIVLTLLLLPFINFAQNDPGPNSYEPSDPCCPALEGYTEAGCGWQYDGEKCVFDIGVDIDDYEMFFWDNQLWVLPSCPNPVGDECCPDGFTYDGWNACYFIGDENIHTDIPSCLPYIIDNDDKWMYDDIYTQNGNLYMELECCECPLNELHWDENPIWNNPISNLTPKSFYDGNDNCKTFTEFDPDTDYFVYNGLFTIDRDCDEYGEHNFCCPEGFSWNGGDGCFLTGLTVSDEDWFVWDGSLYFKADCCPFAFNTNEHICNMMKTAADENASESVGIFYMANNGSYSFEIDTECVRDRVIIRINGNVVVDSGNYSTEACDFDDCRASHLGTCGDDTFGCGSPFSANFSYEQCDEIRVLIQGDPCNDNGHTEYQITCD